MMTVSEVCPLCNRHGSCIALSAGRTLSTVMSGEELRSSREAASARVIDIARALGVHPSNVVRLEQRRRPRPASVDRYLAAVAICDAERRTRQAELGEVLIQAGIELVSVR